MFGVCHKLMSWVCVLLMVAASAPTSLWAAPSKLERARRAYERLDYDEVLPLVEKALAEGPSLSEQIEAFLLMVNVHIAYGRHQEAVQAFEQLLNRSPEFTLDSGVSPKLREALQQARQRRADAVVMDTVVAAPVDDSGPGHDLKTRAEPAASDPLWARWWVWTVAGAVLVLGGSSVLAWQLSTDDRPSADHVLPAF